MSEITRGKMVEILKPLLKDNGFKKSATTWHKITDDIIFVLNLQGSQWGPEYYINLGVYLKALGSELKPKEYSCHIRRRIEHNNKTVESIVDEAMKWFNTHGNVEALIRLNAENCLPLTTWVSVKEYLEAREN